MEIRVVLKLLMIRILETLVPYFLQLKKRLAASDHMNVFPRGRLRCNARRYHKHKALPDTQARASQIICATDGAL